MKLVKVTKANYKGKRLTDDLAAISWFEYVWELELACGHESDSNFVTTLHTRPPTGITCDVCKAVKEADND